MRTPFYRPTLNLGAVRAPDDPVERANMLAKLMGTGGQEVAGAAVVYVTLQKTAVEVAQSLVAMGLDARPYHAGLPPLQREVCQRARGGRRNARWEQAGMVVATLFGGPNPCMWKIMG